MSIYKECDIRGIYGTEFNEKDAYEIGRAIGSMMTAKTLVVGGDVRLSTPVLKESLMKGLLDSGANLIDVGVLPTPAFYFSIKHLSSDGGVMVTASHNPAAYNGFKLMLGAMPVTPQLIDSIGQQVIAQAYICGKGAYQVEDTTSAYIQQTLDRFAPVQSDLKPLKVVLDCGNGATSELAPLLFSRLGYEVVPLYCKFDGSFPNRDPNPAVYKNLKDIRQTIIDCGADFGAAFDGDGDRVVFVDNQGQVVSSERGFAIFIREYLSKDPSPVVYDIKSSSIVKNTILTAGGQPLMERSGHAFIKKTFLENQAALGGEISGHFFFGELGYDDGIYAALVMGRILSYYKSNYHQSLADILTGVPETLITPDIRIFCPYDQRDSWLEKVQQAAQNDELPVTLLDGIRVDLKDGWILIRKSVTEEGITMRIEAKDQEGLKQIQQWVIAALPELAEKLDLIDL